MRAGSTRLANLELYDRSIGLGLSGTHHELRSVTFAFQKARSEVESENATTASTPSRTALQPISTWTVV